MSSKSSRLYLLEYNNYYSRTIKREGDNGADYLDYLEVGPIICNFNPNDGVDTQHIVNTDVIDGSPSFDYCIETDSTDTVISRWFVVETTRKLGGQYEISLHRDLVADFYYPMLKCPVFIERATLGLGSPFILNSEGMNFNQIKTKEVLLKDKTASGWYIGYIANNMEEKTVTIPTESAFNYPRPTISFDTLTSIQGNQARIPSVYTISANAKQYAKSANFYITVNTNGAILREEAVRIDTTPGETPIDSNYEYRTASTPNENATLLAKACKDNAGSIGQSIRNNLAGQYTFQDASTINTLIAMDGQTFYDETNNRVFSVSFTKKGETILSVRPSDGVAYETISSLVASACNMTQVYQSSSKKRVDVAWQVVLDQYVLLVQDITATQSVSITIKPTTNTLNDAPYKMFASPADNVPVTYSGDLGSATFSSPSVAKRLVNALARELSSFLYDIQYLPYCPLAGSIGFVGGANRYGIQLNGTVTDNSNTSISFAISNGSIQTYMLWCKSSNFSLNIEETIECPADPIEFKTEHETSFCRIVSPNYNGSFEFKPTSNYGVDYFEVNCSYKPYQPYIHVNPKFSNEGLYGGDFNDQRGLVCGGDFSLPIVTDQWVAYQIQNASYRDAFNRQVENMETTYKYNREQALASGVVNAITAGLSGATAGAMAGSLGGAPGTAIGAGVGALVGGVAGGVGLAQDLKYSDLLQEEALSYAKDQFNYSLQNIQALPYSLGRVSAFTINNKVFPFLEYYTATQNEKEAFKYRLKYRGMTVGVIGKIEDYLQDNPTFIQGSIIQYVNINGEALPGDDYHLISALANEIHKGVYI